VNRGLKFILLSGVVLGAWYIPTILATLKLQFSISGFSVDSIKANYLDATVQLKVKNPTGVNVSVTDVAGAIILNGVQVGVFSEKNRITIPAKSQYLLNIAFTVDYTLVGKTLWSALINSNLAASQLTLTGSIVANLKKLPFTSNWTIKDITH